MLPSIAASVEGRKAQPGTERSGALAPPRRLVFLLAVIAIGWVWLVTEGSGKFLVAEPFGQYFDGLARSLTQGRLDVTPDAISGEAFVVNGKYYGYFGPFPAVPRIVLNAVVPRLEGHWSRLSVFLAAVLHLVVLILLLRFLGCPLDSGFTLLFIGGCAFGSTLLYILCQSHIYHESIMWASALAFASAYAALRYIDEPRRTAWLAAASLLAIASFFSRATVGAGAASMLAALALFPPEPERGVPLRIRVAAAATILFCASLYITMNWVRFGTVLNAAPYRYFLQATPERLARTQGTLIHPEVLPFQAVRVLGLGGLTWRKSFPWFSFANTPDPRVWPAHYDYMESHVGLAAAEPGLALLAVIGLIWGVRRWQRPWRHRLMLAALLAPIGLLTIFAAMSHRYQHDAFPFLATAGAVGASWLVALPRSWKRSTGLAFTAVLICWSLLVTPALSIILQREMGWTADELARQKYQRARTLIDTFVGGQPVPVLRVKDGTEAAGAIAGQMLVWEAADGVPESCYWFDGARWRLVGGPERGVVALKLNLSGVVDGRWVMLTTGKPGALDAFWLMVAGDGAEVCMDHWGVGVACGSFFQPGFGDHHVIFQLNPLDQKVRVVWDGTAVFERSVPPHPFTEKQIQPGRSPRPEVHGLDFPGSLEREPAPVR